MVYYSACVRISETKKKLKSLSRHETQKFIYSNELAKAYFQHDMAYGKSKDPAKRTQSKF